MRISGRTNSTPGYPSLHRAGPGRRKRHKKRSQRERGLSLSLSPLCAGALFSSHLWVEMPSHLKDEFSCYFLSKIELQHGTVTLICLRAKTVCSRPENYNTVCPGPESCDVPRALMSVTPNLCCDKTEPRSRHSSDRSKVI